MIRFLRKLVFWGVVFLVLRHAFAIAKDLAGTLGTSAQVAVTVTNLHLIDAALQREELMENSYPVNFDAFMDQNFQGDLARTRLDTWGQPFGYEPLPNGYMLGSSGPDGQFGTEDDMSITRQGKQITTELNPPVYRPAGATLQFRSVLARIRLNCTGFARRVRTEFYRLREEVRKARIEKQRKRAFQGG
jgi:hypothetical protein